MVINAVGSVTTGLIAVIVVVSKFTEGAWIPAALIPVMVVRLPVDRQALRAQPRRWRSHRPGYRPPRETHTMVVLVGGVNKGVLEACSTPAR